MKTAKSAPKVTKPTPARSSTPQGFDIDMAALPVHLDLIHPSEHNNRLTSGLSDESIAELAASITAAGGILFPLIIRLHPDRPGKYELVCGERRLLAAQQLKMTTVPCRLGRLSDEDARAVQIVENLQRVNLVEIEEATGYEDALKLVDEATGTARYSIETLAASIGKSPSHIYSRLKLLKLSGEGRQALMDGRLSASVALLIARIPAPTDRDEFLADCLTGEMSFREAKYAIEQNFMVRLKGAAFDQADPDLVPRNTEAPDLDDHFGGACETCPRRTGNLARRYPDMGVDSADVCTLPSCFQKKVESHTAAAVAAAQAKAKAEHAAELKVIPVDPQIWRKNYEGDHETAPMQLTGYGEGGKVVDLDAACPLDPNGATWRAVAAQAAVVQRIKDRLDEAKPNAPTALECPFCHKPVTPAAGTLKISHTCSGKLDQAGKPTRLGDAAFNKAFNSDAAVAERAARAAQRLDRSSSPLPASTIITTDPVGRVHQLVPVADALKLAQAAGLDTSSHDRPGNQGDKESQAALKKRQAEFQTFATTLARDTVIAIAATDTSPVPAGSLLPALCDAAVNGLTFPVKKSLLARRQLDMVDGKRINGLDHADLLSTLLLSLKTSGDHLALLADCLIIGHLGEQPYHSSGITEPLFSFIAEPFQQLVSQLAVPLPADPSATVIDPLAAPTPAEPGVLDPSDKRPWFMSYVNRWGRIITGPEDVPQRLELSQSPSVYKITGAFQAQTPLEAESEGTRLLHLGHCMITIAGKQHGLLVNESDPVPVAKYGAK